MNKIIEEEEKTREEEEKESFVFEQGAYLMKVNLRDSYNM